MNPLNPQVGDLVQTVFQSSGYRLEVYEWWGSKERGFPEKNHFMASGDIGVVLESLENQGGNGCKIMLQDGRVGWANVNYLKRLGSETR